MTMPDLVSRNGELTPDGARLVEWIEAQFAQADHVNDLGYINGMSHYLSYYYVNVKKLKSLSPAQWITEHRLSSAAAAWRDMEYFEEVARAEAEKQAVVETVVEQTSELAGQIDALRHALEEAVAEIAALKAVKGGKGKKAAVKEADAEPVAAVEPDSEAQPAEDEAEDEPTAESDEKVDDEAEASEKEA